MASKKGEFVDITEDLFLDDVDGGAWNSSRSRDNSKDKAFESEGNKRHRRGERSSDEDQKREYAGSRGSRGSVRKMRGRYAEREGYEEGGRFRRRRFNDDNGSPFPREEKDGSGRRFDERESRGSRRSSRKKSASRDRSPVNRREPDDNSGSGFDKDHKHPSSGSVNMSDKSNSRSRSLTRNKRSVSRSSSGSSSGSSRSHSSGSSSSHRQSPRNYFRRQSESQSPKSYSPKARARSSPYAQEPQMHQPQGWYPNQGFPGPAPNQGNFQNMPMPHQAVYPPAEGSYGTNYQNQGFPNNYQQFQGYEASGSNYYPQIGTGFPPATQEYSQGQPWDSMIYPDTSMPPPIQQLPLPVPNPSSQAVEQELIQQKRTLSKQREDYLKKSNSLKNELNRLKEQKRDLLQENSKDNERILRENAKLQNEIQQKLKAINNVIEMLSGIIGDSSEAGDKESKTPTEAKTGEKKKRPTDNTRSSSSPEVTEVKLKNEKPSVNLVHYDPELHWCSDCNVFPRTAIDYLNHLHTEEHKLKIAANKTEDLPWHLNESKEKISPFIKNAPSKRIPIRGLQFFTPATAWYCKLCKTWLGDLHCASNHLKSSMHSDNYSEYTSQNPHWEVDWLSDRTRSYERNSESKSRIVGNGAKVEKPPSPSPPLSETSVNLTSLSDQILAMLAANNKGSRPPPPPPPPPPPEAKPKTGESESSGSESSDSSSKKTKKKKRKKAKKKVKKEEEKESPKKPPPPLESPKADSEFYVSEYDIPVKFPSSSRKHSEVDGDDKIIREWMAPPDNVDRELTTSLKGRLKQKHETEQQRRRDDLRYKDDNRRDRHGDRRYDRGRDYREHRDREGRRKEESSSSREKRPTPPEPRSSRYHDREAEAKQAANSVLEERWKAEKPQGKIWAPGKDDEDEVETTFEKRTSESAAKKKDTKKPPLMSLPKTKLPFIGRMPILKKKPSDQKPEEKEPKEEKKSEIGKLPQRKEVPVVDEEKKPPFVWPDLPHIPEPPIMDDMTTTPPSSSSDRPLPKSTLIISKRPRLIEPEPLRRDSDSSKMRDSDILGEQDMDIEEDTPKDELHKDFKDALELLFPGESTDKERGTEEMEGKDVGMIVEDVKSVVDMGAPLHHPGYMTHPMMGGQYMGGSVDGQYMGGSVDGQYMGGSVDGQYMGGSVDGQYMGGSVDGQYMGSSVDSLYRVGGDGQQRYGGYGEQQQPPPPGLVPPPPASYAAAYPGYMVDGSYMAAQGYPAPPPPMPPPDVPPPPGLEDEPEEQPPLPPPVHTKRKNPLSQRMRRHLKKKAAVEQVDTTADVSEEEPYSERMAEISDLAMLGIDEEDITAQSFH